MNTSKEITDKELKKFGLTLAIAIALLFGILFPTIFNRQYINISWFFVIYFTFSALLFPGSLRLFYKLWSRIGRILNWINTKLILGVIFIFLFIPISLLFRLIMRDALNRKFDKDIKSYREKPTTDRQKVDLTRPY